MTLSEGRGYCADTRNKHDRHLILRQATNNPCPMLEDIANTGLSQVIETLERVNAKQISAALRNR